MKRVRNAARYAQARLLKVVVIDDVVVVTAWKSRRAAAACPLPRGRQPTFQIRPNSELLRHGRGGVLAVVLPADLARQELRVDRGNHASTTDSDVAHVLIQLLIAANGELDVARDDSVLFLVLSRVAGQLQDFSNDVLNHRGKVDRTPDCQPLRVASPPQLLGEAVHGGSMYSITAVR